MKRKSISIFASEEEATIDFSKYQKIIMQLVISFHYLVSLIMTSDERNFQKL